MADQQQNGLDLSFMKEFEAISRGPPNQTLRRLNDEMQKLMGYFQPADRKAKWQLYLEARNESARLKVTIDQKQSEIREYQDELREAEQRRTAVSQKLKVNELTAKRLEETLTKEEVLTNEARLSLASCQQALAREKDKYEQAEWRKAELMQQLDETKRELGGKVHQVAERVKEQSTEHCQMIMQLNTMQQEMELKNDLQQRQAMTNTRQTENQLNLLEAGAHAGVSEEKLHEVVHKMKELITSRGDKLLLEAQAFYGSKVEDAEKRGNFELSALQQTNDHLRNSLEEMTLAFENLIFQRQRKEQRINEMHEQVQKMLNDKVLLTRDDTDCEVADEVDRFYGMVLQAQNELTYGLDTSHDGAGNGMDTEYDEEIMTEQMWRDLQQYADDKNK